MHSAPVCVLTCVYLAWHRRCGDVTSNGGRCVFYVCTRYRLQYIICMRVCRYIQVCVCVYACECESASIYVCNVCICGLCMYLCVCQEAVAFRCRINTNGIHKCVSMHVCVCVYACMYMYLCICLRMYVFCYLPTISLRAARVSPKLAHDV